MRSLLFLLLSAIPACGARPAATPQVVEGQSMIAVTRGVYADPGSSSEDREKLARWQAESTKALADFFYDGDASKVAVPVLFSCVTESCVRHFCGPMGRSHARLDPTPAIFVNGVDRWTKGTILHEMVHVEIAIRARRAGTRAGSLPAWFEEGVATFIGDNGRCAPNTAHAIDDLRRLERPRAWVGFTNMRDRMAPAYCQARDEIAAWTARHDRRALASVIDAVAGGASFDSVYGELVTARPESEWSRKLHARFAFDENRGTHATDGSGRNHAASLMNGATWTSGKRGGGVKVGRGAYVVADGLDPLGIPDAPFSLGLWVMPSANANVLVHTAVNRSGGDGFCLPLLGYDATGHIVAQAAYDADARAMVSAVGPVLPLGAWSYVLTSWNARDGLRLYVDGQLVGSVPAKHRLAPAAPLSVFLGTDRGASCWTQRIESGDFSGVVDDVRVWDHALSEDEVRAVFAE